MEIVVSNRASRPLYEQIASQIKAAIMSVSLIIRVSLIKYLQKNYV